MCHTQSFCNVYDSHFAESRNLMMLKHMPVLLLSAKRIQNFWPASCCVGCGLYGSSQSPRCVHGIAVLLRRMHWTSCSLVSRFSTSRCPWFGSHSPSSTPQTWWLCLPFTHGKCGSQQGRSRSRNSFLVFIAFVKHCLKILGCDMYEWLYLSSMNIEILIEYFGVYFDSCMRWCSDNVSARHFCAHIITQTSTTRVFDIETKTCWTETIKVTLHT